MHAYIRAILAWSLFCHLVDAVAPVVHLDYSTYRGYPMSNGVTQWLGMRYAQPPVGDLRFAAPRSFSGPYGDSGIIDASRSGPVCLETNQSPPGQTISEDCLFIDVYAPSQASPNKLPVYVFIQGGGFNSNANAGFNGYGLVSAANMEIITVTFNYRVGLYGFLASKEIAQGGSINNGLKDQRAALQWVQRYISYFGGDPTQVTLGGASAGAQSVLLHLTAYGGRNDNLFARTAAESQSFSALRTVQESQFEYDALSQRLGCSKSQDSLKCLRGLSAATLQSQNINLPFPGATGAPLYMYGPVLDGEFITDYTFHAISQGKFVKLPAIYGDVTNEGTVFVPRNTASQSDSNNFLRNQFPKLTDNQLSSIAGLYPVTGTRTFPGAGAYWRQASNAYGELRYVCPGIFTSSAYASQNLAQSWNYHWNVIDQTSDSDGLGVSHIVELGAIWGPTNVYGAAPKSYYPSGANAAMVPLIQSYWTSFIRTGNPNTYRLAGAPEWNAWTSQNGFARLKFQTGQTAMETVPDDQKRRCAYLSSIASSLEQ